MILRAGPSLERPLGRVLAFAAGAALVIAARVFDRGEPFNDRTGLLIFLAFIGGAFGSAPVFFLLMTRVGARLRPPVRLVLGAILTAAGFLACTYLAFGIHLKFLREPDELDFTSPEFHLGDLHVIGRMIDALGLFVVTGQRYFLIWPVVAVAVIGGWLAVRPYGAGIVRKSSPAAGGTDLQVGRRGPPKAGEGAARRFRTKDLS